MKYQNKKTINILLIFQEKNSFHFHQQQLWYDIDDFSGNSHLTQGC